MNWRRGLKRAWLICSALYASLSIALSYPLISYEFTEVPGRPPHPWIMLLATLILAFGPPAVMYILGKAAFWIAAGFKRTG